jgi:DNA-binding CsgD family transcriptional regulator
MVGRSQRDAYQVPRARKLTADEQSRLRAVADGRSLRSLGAEFGISHEAVRTILREREPALA